MTANQISAQANREAARHNEELEGIQKEKNRIDEEHYQRMDTINDQYNQKSLALQEAQGWEKLRLQKDLQDLEADKFRELSEYHQLTVGLEQQNQQLKERGQAWLERYQSNMIKLEMFEKYNDMQKNILEGKRIDYEHEYWENLIRVQDYNSMINWKRTEQENEQNIRMYNLNYQRALIEAKLAGSEVELNKIKGATAVANSIFGGIKTLTGTISPFALAGTNFMDYIFK